MYDNIEIVLSSILLLSDHGFEDKINETCREEENLRKCKGKTFTNNYNIDSTWHNKIKLHLNLNKGGTSHCLNLFQK